MKLFWTGLVVATLALVPSFHAFSAPEAAWQIPRNTYPSRIQLHQFAPANRMADRVLGHFHHHSYPVLRRQDGVGAVRAAIHTVWWKHRRIQMRWTTVASSYPSPALARAAAADLGLPLTDSVPQRVESGSRIIRRGSMVGILSVGLRGAAIVEQFSSVSRTIGRAVAVMQHYDWLQRTAWSAVLVRLTAPIRTPTDAPTDTPRTDARLDGNRGANSDEHPSPYSHAITNAGPDTRPAEPALHPCHNDRRHAHRDRRQSLPDCHRHRPGGNAGCGWNATKDGHRVLLATRGRELSGRP